MRKETWDQLKNVTADELKRAIDKDPDWYADETGNSAIIYRNDVNHRMVSIHVNPHKTFGHRQLKQLLEDIGWTEADLKRLKLIK